MVAAPGAGLESTFHTVPGHLSTRPSSLPHRDLVAISSRSRRTAWRLRGGPSLGDIGDRVLGSLGEVRVRVRARARARARVRVRVGARVRARVRARARARGRVEAALETATIALRVGSTEIATAG